MLMNAAEYYIIHDRHYIIVTQPVLKLYMHKRKP